MAKPYYFPPTWYHDMEISRRVESAQMRASMVRWEHRRRVHSRWFQFKLRCFVVLYRLGLR